MTAALGHQLAQIRMRSGITVDRMAAELGLSAFDVSAVEADTRVFSESRPLLNFLSSAGSPIRQRSGV